MFRVYLSRSLGAYTMGVYQVAFSVFVVMIAAVTSGVPLFVSTQTAKPQIAGNAAEQRVLTSGVIANILLSVFAIAFVIVLRPTLLRIFADDFSHTILLLLLPAVIFTAVSEVYKSNLWGHKKYTLVSVLELTEQVIRIALCLVLLSIAKDVFMRASFAALSLSLVSGAGLFMVIVAYAKAGGKYSKPSTQDFGRLTRIASPITLLRLISSAVNFLIATILPLRLTHAGMSSVEAIAAYGSTVGMSLGFIYAPLTLTGALSTALVPELSADAANNNYKSVAERAEKAIIFAILCSCALVPVFFIAGKDICMVVFNNEQSGQFLVRAAFLMIPASIEQITCSCLNALGCERICFKNSLCGTVFLLSGIWILPKFIGIDALIAGMAMSYILSAILNISILRKKANLSLDFLKPLALNLVFLIPSLSAVWGLKKLLAPMPDLPVIFLLAAVGIGFMVLFNICFNIIDFSDFSVKAPKTKKETPMFKADILQ